MVKEIKKIGLIGLVGVALFATGCGCSKDKKTEEKETNKEPETTINTNEEVIKDQEFEGLKMTNTSLVTVGGVSTLVTEVSNNTGSDYYLNEFTITAKNADGKVLATLPGYVGDVIRNGETKVINSSIDIDLSSATSIEYSVVR